MKRILFTVLCTTLCVVFLCAQNHQPKRGVPARRDARPYVQPNGDTLTIRLFGDERSHFCTTEDGYVIREDDTKTYCYALAVKDGTKPSKMQAHNANKRTEKEKKWLEKKGIKKNLKEVTN